MICKYEFFKESLLLEQIINESLICYSPPLRNILNKMKSKGYDIADELIKIEKTDVKPDITFVDISDEGYFSFTTMKKVEDILKNIPNIEKDVEFDYEYIISHSDYFYSIRGDSNYPFYTKNRNPIKIGRFINRVLNKKYKEKDIEDFVNELKSVIFSDREHFEIVSGDDISYWYDSNHYYDGNGTLGSSCMRNKGDYIFEIYVKNPEVCKMLILLKENKLIGRAILWKPSVIKETVSRRPIILNENQYFMDRVYTNKDSLLNTFIRYADDNDFLHKTRNTYSHTYGVMDKGGDNFNVYMEVELNKINYSNFPYMDTFKIYDPSSGILNNSSIDDADDYTYEGFYRLESTGGDYEIIDFRHYSEYYDEMIPRDESVWSDPLGDYIWDSLAVEVRRSSCRSYRGWYPRDYDSIIYSKICNQYFACDDVVYSEYYRDYIYNEDAYECVTNVDKFGKISHGYDNYVLDSDINIISLNKIPKLVMEMLIYHDGDWEDYEYISGDILVDTENGKVPKSISIEVYKCLNDNRFEYLSEIDSSILDIEIYKNNKKILDKFTYNREIQSHEKFFTNKLKYKENLLDDNVYKKIKFNDDNDLDKETRDKLLSSYENRLNEYSYFIKI
jgi:hypothetical protein